MAIRVIESERSVFRMVNEAQNDGDAQDILGSTKLNPAQLISELEGREMKMKTGTIIGGITDQWRIYIEIIDSIREGRYLRMMVQASAGTGKSFLLTTVYLWCIVNGKNCKAAAPTGIAAANVEIEKTDVCAQTIHSLLDFDGEYNSKLDLGKTQHPKVAMLLALKVLLLDEVSMLDTECFASIVKVLSNVSDTRGGGLDNLDDRLGIGKMHLLLFGDFKQLPPSTSRAPFITNDVVLESFVFRVLRQNRRVVQDPERQMELDLFHDTLNDISWGRPSDRVRAFFVQSYVRGALKGGTADKVNFEGSTAIFTKRRYRDKWNRNVVARVSKQHNHILKVKGKYRARGARDSFFSDSKARFLKKASTDPSIIESRRCRGLAPRYRDYIFIKSPTPDESDAGCECSSRHALCKRR